MGLESFLVKSRQFVTKFLQEISVSGNILNTSADLCVYLSFLLLAQDEHLENVDPLDTIKIGFSTIIFLFVKSLMM